MDEKWLMDVRCEFSEAELGDDLRAWHEQTDTTDEPQLFAGVNLQKMAGIFLRVPEFLDQRTEKTPIPF